MQKFLLAFSLFLFAAVGTSAAVYADELDLDALCEMLCAVQMGGLLCDCNVPSVPGTGPS